MSRTAWKKQTGARAHLHRNIFAALFITGGRVSEVVELKPSNFRWNDEAIKVEGMLVKKYRKYKRRDFLIKRDEHEVLADDLIEFVSHCENEYLFPRTKPFTGEIISDQHTSTARMYLLVQEITKDLWCHWFRGQRASFNVFVRRMDVFQLKDWFMWKSLDTPAHYINQTLEGMAEQLGIKKIPS